MSSLKLINQIRDWLMECYDNVPELHCWPCIANCEMFHDELPFRASNVKERFAIVRVLFFAVNLPSNETI